MDSSFDILSDVLNSLHICGSLLLHESYTAPWAITLPSADRLGTLLKAAPSTRVVAFHLVKQGHIEFRVEGASSSAPLIVEAGEMVICFGGTSHQISQGRRPQQMPVERVLAGHDIPFRCAMGDRSSSLVCLCGVFYLEDTALNPLFSALPPLLHAPISQTKPSRNLVGVADLIAQELDQRAPGSNFMIERLLELLCASAIRTYMDMLEPGQSNWLTSLRDPVVGKALALVHRNPSHSWSVTTLAQAVALSPSRFSARFRSTLGESPMNYVSKWRIHVSCRLLRSPEQSIAEIAAQVGYESLPAFARAFKRHLRMPPGVWRSRQLKG